MNTIRLSTFVLLVCSVAWPQYHGPVGNGHDRKRWAEPPEQHNATHLSDRPDLRELKRDAEELANLSQTIPADVEAISRGLLSSNLNERLKRIDAIEQRPRHHAVSFAPLGPNEAERTHEPLVAGPEEPAQEADDAFGDRRDGVREFFPHSDI